MPINLKRLQGVLSRVMKPSALEAEVAAPAADLDRSGRFGHLRGRAPSGNLAGPGVTLPAGTPMVQSARALIPATPKHDHHHKARSAAVPGLSLKTLHNRLKDDATGGEDGAVA